MAIDMNAEIKRLEPLVATAIAEADRIRTELDASIRELNPTWTDARVQFRVLAAFALEHNDLSHAEQIAVGRAAGKTDEQIAQELALVEAQGMW